MSDGPNSNVFVTAEDVVTAFDVWDRLTDGSSSAKYTQRAKARAIALLRRWRLQNREEAA